LSYWLGTFLRDRQSIFSYGEPEHVHALGEAYAMAKGAGPLEIRVVDEKSRIWATVPVGFALFEEIRLTGAAAQARMTMLARDYRTSCMPSHDDPWDRDIIVI